MGILISDTVPKSPGKRFLRWRKLAWILFLVSGITGWTWGQTPSTGALTVAVFDPSGAVVRGARVRLTNADSREEFSATTDENGALRFPLLAPGTYELQLDETGFKTVTRSDIHIQVTETLRLEAHLEMAARSETSQISSELSMLQLDTAGLGRVVSEGTATGLPLVNRNFTQIAGLSPGVSAGVYNAGELGTGGTALSQLGKSNDGVYVHGMRSYDNNWQLDGISVSDVQGSGSISGGIPIPNPDTLEEFKVQTGLYDAAFGRGAGANVSVITKAGGNDVHATFFEFVRNNIFNAKDFFLNETGQPKPDLKQNQFGFALGVPIRKDRVFFFGSYQGTRQINGVASGQSRIACTASLSEPPLTNDRSALALGRLFGGMSGVNGGIAVDPDGSNINPVALALLNFKLPDGTFLVPSPQTVDPSKPIASQGFSVFTHPCASGEDQGLGNIDYSISQSQRLAGRFFVSDSRQAITFPGGGLNPLGNISGFNGAIDSTFVVFSVAHTYVLSSNLLNEARIGLVRTSTMTSATAPFEWSDVGVSEATMNDANQLPSLSILGSVSMASVFPRTYTQSTFVFSDDLSWSRAAHSLKLGGSLTPLQDNLDFVGPGSYLQFLSWPDFLLGLNGVANGTRNVSNVFASTDLFGLLNREFRVWEGSGFLQDDYRINRTLNLNLGVRYERLGQFGDALGRNSSFDINRANPSPPSSGTLEGYLVSSDFAGTPPAGVTRVNNTFGNYGRGQNSLAPRISLAWQPLPWTRRFVLRTGYGMYYSRPPGQTATLSVLAAPYGLYRVSSGLENANATFQAPFAQPFPTPSSFPLFAPYSPSTKTSITVLAPNFLPAMVQQFSLNAQEELHDGWLLETGYVGGRGVHLQRLRSLNQALSASAMNPIRGADSNTLANIGIRVRIPGVPPDALREMESESNSWYNGLEISLTKRVSHGLQFLASYTFSETLDTDGADINSTSSGNALTLGDQNSPKQRWGRASFDRTHRFVLSETWDLPNPHADVVRAMMGGWSLASVITIQSGTALTIADTNTHNVFGISEDRAGFTGTCTKAQWVRGGSVESKLDSYFNTSCFTIPPIIGADGIGTGFGNTATGLVDGPPQANMDLALSKWMSLDWAHEKCQIQFRAEFFNALNHPQFANPDSNFTSPTFGVISSTSVNARVGQLALRLMF